MRVLLVEDEVIIGSGVQTAPRQVGYAVDWLQTKQFGLGVLDQGLPPRQTCRRPSGATCSPTRL